MRRIGRDHVADLLVLREADCRSRDLTEELDKLAELRERIADETSREVTLRVADLAVDGNDVMRELGIGPGRSVRRVLERLLEHVTDTPALNQREELLALIRREGGEGR
jgi:hypothetical protein